MAPPLSTTALIDLTSSSICGCIYDIKSLIVSNVDLRSLLKSSIYTSSYCFVLSLYSCGSSLTLVATKRLDKASVVFWRISFNLFLADSCEDNWPPLIVFIIILLCYVNILKLLLKSSSILYCSSLVYFDYTLSENILAISLYALSKEITPSFIVLWLNM
mgnify:CR=1 FL=1